MNSRGDQKNAISVNQLQFLEMNNYEPLEAIGSGSFGIIRKVRRLSDGKLLARKEIDYRKMTEKVTFIKVLNIYRKRSN